MDYKQKLPDDVQAKLDAYIERIKIIKWFQPDANLKKEDVETKVKIALNAFGIKGSIEYKQLKTSNDWDAARGAARDAAQDAAQDVAWGAARDVAWDAARDVARDVAWGAARDAAQDVAWDAARDVAWNAARNAAWDAARDVAWDVAWDVARNAAQDVAWGAARDVAWDAARDVARDVAWGAVDLLVENLDEYKKKYPNGNFINLIPLWEMGLYPIGLIDGKFVIYIPALKMEFPNDLV